MNGYTASPNSPWKSLLILVGLTIGLSIAVQMIVLVGNIFITGDWGNIINDSNSIYADHSNLTFLYLLLASSSIGTFLLPAIFLQKIESYATYFPVEDINKIKNYVLAAVLLFAFAPLMQLIGEWNMRMQLPEAMGGVENWMRAQEDNMAVLTKNIVMVDSVGLLLLNIVVMAVLPAIAEEYFFRGSLQHIFQRVFKNHHVTVWVTAIIFSAIHVQFYGFFPRLILGVFFGYMFVWSRNIWIPIICHFLNNASVTVLAYVYTKQGKTYADLQASESYPIIVYLGSLVLTAVIGWYFYKQIHQNKAIDGERLDQDQIV
ncbi:CPBP family intramembrane glutamic endopeptidase [Sphingobacterium pedocola]|uniref:CPBP family intramembrane metalloprotease domain-containing protein n=1 Tax=Sphingobacterium pedocola TaxID=2082722 RepID=A0ABR9T859_9SPHI|nr:CPBP family intramembrane glutamic endopeptidase [Sphingobacterium pedocola]MBE8721529.1 CPBP family intramembrane metalloprotease domain-containing protein [Sphingobacterium pedocola]